MKSIFLGSLLALIVPGAWAKAKPMKALIVVTSHSELGTTGKKTGYYLPEVSHPFYALEAEGIEVDIASPRGGKAPMDEKSRDLSDPLNKKMVEEESKKLEKTLKLSDVNTSEYQAIIFAGGHGTMWDFAQTPSVKIVAEEIYNKGGVLAAVCHGPAALLKLTDKTGTPLVKGKRISSFTNEEEEAAGLTHVMPFLLETEFIKLGAKFEESPVWQKKVIVDGRIVTGQNPASAEGVGQETARLLKSMK